MPSSYSVRGGTATPFSCAMPAQARGAHSGGHLAASAAQVLGSAPVASPASSIVRREKAGRLVDTAVVVVFTCVCGAHGGSQSRTRACEPRRERRLKRACFLFAMKEGLVERGKEHWCGRTRRCSQLLSSRTLCESECACVGVCVPLCAGWAEPPQ